MKKLFTSTLLTVVAVPFLMASPGAKKVQAQTADSTQTPDANQGAATKKAKKHQKKHKGTMSNTQDSNPAPKQ